MARKGPVGGAFGKSIRKKPGTGTRNLQTYHPKTKREAQVMQLLRQKSAELEEMRKMLGPLANELVRHGLTPKEAELARQYLNELWDEEKIYLSKNPEMFAKLAKSAAEVESVIRKYKAARDARDLADDIPEKYRTANEKLNEIRQELRAKIKEAERLEAHEPLWPPAEYLAKELGRFGVHWEEIAVALPQIQQEFRITEQGDLLRAPELLADMIKSIARREELRKSYETARNGTEIEKIGNEFEKARSTVRILKDRLKAKTGY